MFFRCHFKGLSVALLLLFSDLILAAQSQSTSQISIEITEGCVLDNGSGGSSFGTLDFGEHSHLDLHIDVTGVPGSGAIGFRCSPGVTYRAELDNGQNTSIATERKLLNSATGETVRYEIYQDASRSQLWDASNPVSATASGEQQWLPVYGRIPALQSTPSAGVYSDRLEVLLVF